MQKTDGACFFRKNTFARFWAKTGPKRAQNEVFLKIASLLFSDFGPELEKFKGPIKLLLSSAPVALGRLLIGVNLFFASQFSMYNICV